MKEFYSDLRMTMKRTNCLEQPKIKKEVASKKNGQYETIPQDDDESMNDKYFLTIRIQYNNNNKAT